MGWESSGVVRFDLRPLLQGQMRIAKLKSAYNSLIIGPRGFGALSLRWIQFASVLRCARSSYCFPYLTTSPTCSDAGGAGDLVSLLIYLRKSSCVVPSKKERQSLHGSLL